VGHDQQQYVSEISIPEPVISKDLESLNRATTLQPFDDLTGGIFNAEEMVIPRSGIEYLPALDGGSMGKIHFTWGQHIQDFEASYGWGGLDLSNPQAAGPWTFGGYTNYVSNDYLFEIPTAWADQHAPGYRLAGGRAREGLWSGRGPGLFAYIPPNEANTSSINAIQPLLLYGVQETGMPDIRSDESMAMEGYGDSDHWWGGAWLTTPGGSGIGERSAVIFVGTKAMGDSWYGFANGVVWAMDCSENNTCPEVPEWPYDNRGFWAEGYQAQMIFYDPNELAAVVNGQLETWEPQPYATLVLDEVLFDPHLDVEVYKRDLVGAAAFDRANGLVYVIERMADEYQSVVHVWRVGE
jgi:hypothetical protein